MIEGLRQAKEYDREQRDITNAGKVVAPSVTDILPEKLDTKKAESWNRGQTMKHTHTARDISDVR